MTEDELAPLAAAYRLIESLYEEFDRPAWALTIADALVEAGAGRSWAPVWIAYGAAHHDLRDETQRRALKLLEGVAAPSAARAAALMLRAELELTLAIEHDQSIDCEQQVRMLDQAVTLAPDWPGLHLRLAIALVSAGRASDARLYARQAIGLLAMPPTDDVAATLTGRDLSKTYVTEELQALGLLDADGG